MSAIIVALFPSRESLTHALTHLKQTHPEWLDHAAVITSAADGEIRVLEDDLAPDEGGIAGGTMGAALMAFGMLQMGALTLPGIGPVLAVGGGALVGALIGGAAGAFTAKLLDFGFQNAQIDSLALKLGGGQPALVLELEDSRIIPAVQQALTGFEVEWMKP
jgi:uncharacterized membrane protein